LRSTVDQLQRLATLVRDRTSHDMWRALSRLHERLHHPAKAETLLSGEATAVLNDTLLGLAAFHGLARENMTRAQAWRFLDMGLRLERAVYISTLLNATLRLQDPENPSMLEAVLEVVDSSITFRSRYNLVATLPAVFDLVLLDDKNPRSVLFQAKQLAKHFEKLPKEREEAPDSGKNLLAKCVKRLEKVDTRELAGATDRLAKSEVQAAITETLQTLPRLSNAIAANYFAHTTISRTGRGNES
ncbi:MAG TPA: alpha-E domain-containing protein, partial [Verrucomicrobiae bacterium]